LIEKEGLKKVYWEIEGVGKKGEMVCFKKGQVGFLVVF
jgi:hypothetical protein